MAYVFKKLDNQRSLKKEYGVS